MGVMLATYQYFVVKRSGETGTDKETSELQIELNCLKSNHNYAQALNDKITGANGEVPPEGYELANAIKCAGFDQVKSFKYCLDQMNALVPCQTLQTRGEHCVATARSMEIPNSKRSLLFKLNILEIRNGELDGKSLPPALAGDNIGIVRCIPAQRVTEQAKANNSACGVGEFSEYDPDTETYHCSPVPSINPCTSHEDYITIDLLDGRGNCTQTSETHACCAKSPGSICGSAGGIVPVWNSQTRFYTCTNGASSCPSSANMEVKDERGHTVATERVQDPFTAKYDPAAHTFGCIPDAARFVTACRAAATSANHAFHSVENLNSTTAEPVCRVNSANSNSATENCSACGTPVLANGRWTCQYKSTFEDLHAAGSAYYDSLKAQGCFTNSRSTNCAAHELKIKAGQKNGRDWGMIWREGTKTWECFSCGQGQYNSACGSNQSAGEATCAASFTDGQCISSECSEWYQKRLSDGKCYTNWCRGAVPSGTGARTGGYDAKGCDGVPGYPFMMYNSDENWDCVYCTRAPAEILD
jgi:hypothetical protein